ncbi:hypothetical protein AVEN_249459-1 [Araneus ventricosus]|uniref:HAT C-terminal dimerisation domain-containing protein n=1 Tax=Araneus ventricosus TaxID=182803 RepID=A0A4Y2KZI6_ARAVE|nr:hypothetical protein AVEN_249459-1 [Araneus ventricosus]
MCRVLKQELNRRFSNIESNELLAQCVLLDPRFKRKGFTSEKFQPAKVAVEKKIAGFNIPADKDGIVEETTNNNRKPEKRGEYFIDLWKDFRENVEPENAYAAAISEVDAYLKDKYLAPQEDPLKYWAVNKLRFPRLYKLVERRLCIPATSVPCERIFSKTGNCLTDKRSRLGHKKLSEIIFLNVNW